MSSFDKLNINLFDTDTSNNTTGHATQGSPLSILEAYCEINHIEPFDTIYGLCEKILKDPAKQIYTFSQYGYLFHAFVDFIHNRLSLEGFMTLGDIASEQPLVRDSIIHEAFGYLSMEITNNPEQYADSIIIIDQVANLSGTEQERDAIIKKIDRLGGEVVFLPIINLQVGV